MCRTFGSWYSLKKIAFKAFKRNFKNFKKLIYLFSLQLFGSYYIEVLEMSEL